VRADRNTSGYVHVDTFMSISLERGCILKVSKIVGDSYLCVVHDILCPRKVRLGLSVGVRHFGESKVENEGVE
jgi:hypothetical protein